MTALVLAIAIPAAGAPGFLTASLCASSARSDQCRCCERERLEQAFADIDGEGQEDATD